jgi:hypothetical protein
MNFQNLPWKNKVFRAKPVELCELFVSLAISQLFRRNFPETVAAFNRVSFYF